MPSERLTSARLSAVIPLLVLASYALAALFFSVAQGWRFHWDSCLYVVLAQSLEAGEGYTYLGRPFFLRPPGISVLITLFLDDGLPDFAAINRLFVTFGVAAVFALYFLVKRRHGPWIGLAVALVCGTTPLAVKQANWIMSELPFVACLFAGLALFERAASRDRPWLANSMAGTLCLIAAFYFRSVTVLLLPGMVLCDAVRGRGRGRLRGLIPATVFFAAILPWLLYSQHAVTLAERPAEQLKSFDYKTLKFHMDSADPDSELIPLDRRLRQMRSNAGRVWRGLSAAVTGESEGMALAIASVLMALGYWLSLRRGPLLTEWAWFVFLLAVIDHRHYYPRLLFPAVPFAIVYAAGGLLWISRYLAGRAGHPGFARPVAIAGLAIVLASHVAVLPRSVKKPSGSSARAKLGDWIGREVPDDAVVMASCAPCYSLFAQRPIYTYRHSRSYDVLERYRAEYVILESRNSPWLVRQVKKRQVEAWRSGKRRNRMELVRLQPWPTKAQP